MGEVKYMFVPDTHAPWHDMTSLRRAAKWAAKHKPGRIIHIGDLMDMYLLSRFPKSALRVMKEETVRKELRASEEILQMFARHSHRQMLWLRGNHEARMDKTIAAMPFLSTYLFHEGGTFFDRLAARAAVRYVPSGSVKLRCPGRPVFACHGWRSRARGGYAAVSMVQDRCVVQGHTHGAGLIYVTDALWAMEIGHMLDPTAPCFNYDSMAKHKMNKWRGGTFAWIDDRGNPHLEAA